MCVESDRFDDARLSAVRSLGSSTEFIRHNFTDRRLYDTVYVTANPHVTVLATDTFHDV